ncbi:E3 ubiquitin-protein ligase UHRF1 [Ceratobasidium sp. AG-Ba]|nr:E3 ubiquitin-protein ligase UHRF1 [Ceratobasidium sp. AG-Ba]
MPAQLGGLSEYEKTREENMARNHQMLAQLMGSGDVKVSPGDALAIDMLGIAPPPKTQKKPAAKPKQKAKKHARTEDDQGGKSEKAAPTRPGLGTRRSARNAAKPQVSYAGDGENIVDRSKEPVILSRPGKRWDEDDSEDDDGERERGGTVRVNRLVGRVHDPKTFGLIPGVRIGTWWETRAECSGAAIHAPFVAGISGGAEGAYSVALSGGYDDDVDMGEAFTYTGSGGRDLKGTKANPKNLRTAPQSSHQTFENAFNKALLVSSQTKKPVRVIRGFKLPSKYAPKTGYRYDGIYVVEKAWLEPGNNPGRFKVCKFAFRRVPGQPPIPERSANDDDEEEEDENESEIEAEPKELRVEPEAGSEKENEPVDDEEEEEQEAPKAKRAKVAAAKSGKSAPPAKKKAAPKKKGGGRKMWVYVGK